VGTMEAVVGETEGAIDAVVSEGSATAKLVVVANNNRQIQHCSEDCIDIMMELIYSVSSDDVW